MGHFQLRKKLEMLPINSSSPRLLYPPSLLCVPSKKKLGETITASIDLLMMADDGDLLMEQEVLLDTC
jgi:hypothetical protein